MADEVAVPQICLVIELAQPRKEEDGSITPAEIETIRANLPARYFDIRTVTPEDQTDEDGVYTAAPPSTPRPTIRMNSERSTHSRFLPHTSTSNASPAETASG